MQPRHLFGVFVRTLGLFLFYWSIVNAAYALAHLAPIPLTSKLPLVEDCFWAILFFVLGTAAFFGARFIVQIGYGRVPLDPTTQFD